MYDVNWCQLQFLLCYFKQSFFLVFFFKFKFLHLGKFIKLWLIIKTTIKQTEKKIDFLNNKKKKKKKNKIKAENKSIDYNVNEFIHLKLSHALLWQ